VTERGDGEDRRGAESKAAIADLQILIDEGLASGPAEPFDMQAFIASKEGRKAKLKTPHGRRGHR
jgi:hypothetical protein